MLIDHKYINLHYPYQHYHDLALQLHHCHHNYRHHDNDSHIHHHHYACDRHIFRHFVISIMICKNGQLYGDPRHPYLLNDLELRHQHLQHISELRDMLIRQFHCLGTAGWILGVRLLYPDRFL
jgi:hypothetical protein